MLSSGFDRPNIRLEVRRHTEDAEKRRAIVAHVAEQTQPGLVYVATRNRVVFGSPDLDALKAALEAAG